MQFPLVFSLLGSLIYDGRMQFNGGNVIAFPKLLDFQQVTLKVLRWKEKDKRFVIKDAELVV